MLVGHRQAQLSRIQKFHQWYLIKPSGRSKMLNIASLALVFEPGKGDEDVIGLESTR